MTALSPDAATAASTRPAGVIIDLDGTLVDSVPDLAVAANLMLADLGRDPVPESHVRRWVGNGVPRLVHRVLTGETDGEADEATFSRGKSSFLAHYAEHVCDRSVCFPGVEDGLARLAATGARMACVTNKPTAFTGPLLEGLGIDHFFPVVVCGDTLAEKKPHPAPILHAAAELGLPVERCAVIGDSVSDIAAAQAAGCMCVCLRSGYNQGLDLSQYDPDVLVEDFVSAVEHILQS